MGDDDDDRGGDDNGGGGHYNESSGITPPLRLLPLPSPVGRTRRRSMPCVSTLAPVATADPPPPERRTMCPSSSSPRRLLSACASASHSPLVCFDGWLSRHLLSHRLHLATRAAISRSLDANSPDGEIPEYPSRGDFLAGSNLYKTHRVNPSSVTSVSSVGTMVMFLSLD